MAKTGVDQIERLLSVLHQSDATELEVETDSWRLRVRRYTRGAAASPAPEVHVVSEESPAEPASVLIRSPLVGYFQERSKPLQVGDTVKEGEVVCMVRAMGLMNEVRSPRAGRVAEVLVEDGIAVEYGQPLYRLVGEESDAPQA